ncbi:helix-turn-helix domain-containing protein [Arthrobacter echini]|uniref:Helix-turn-helix domain-containing protein n=2 Tax=Arthrobacter echini TaxID=1529066 RepID=A0A4S5E516_9MICC|nr:helix-turn-helix domain-containing protein [Arthrobacter echini]
MNFRRGNEQIDAALQNPDIAARVAAIRAGNRENDRTYKMQLAMIRDAANLTQTELAQNMDSTQGVVSKLERSENMLLQTLLRYLNAAGADDVRIVVSMKGQEIEVDLDNVRDDLTKTNKMEAV